MNQKIEITKEDQEKFYVERDPFDVYVPTIFKERIEDALKVELELSETDPTHDPYGFSKTNRTYRHNFESFRQRSMFLVGLIYYLLSPKRRIGKGYMLCADLSENYLSNILGDCTRNHTKIGWKSIRKFLIKYEIIEICDSMYLHDSIYRLEPQCIGYTLFGLTGVKHKPKSIKYKKSGRKGCTCKKFKYNDFLLERVHIDDVKLLNSLAKNRVRYIKTTSVLGIQSVMLTKLGITDKDYKYVKENIIGVKRSVKLNGKFSELKSHRIHKKFELDSIKRRKIASIKFLKAVHENTPWEIQCSQSVKTNRIYSGFTTLKKEIRPYLFNKEFPNERFVEIDFKSCQLTLLVMLYVKDTGDREVFKNLIYAGDIYEKLAKRCNFLSSSENYTRDSIKEEVFHYIFSNRYTGIDSVFMEAIGGVLGRKFVSYVNRAKGRRHKGKLATKLQSLEARLMIGRWDISATKCSAALCELYRQGIFALSIHDSIVVMEKDKDMAFKIMERVLWSGFRNLLGLDIINVNYFLKIKVWEKPTHN